MTEIIVVEPGGEASTDIAILEATNADKNPVVAFLSRVSAGSRPTVLSKLNIIAEIASNKRLGALEFPWATLRYQHTAYIRSELASRYKHTTANNMLSFLKSVLKECWRLELMNAEDERRASDLKQVTGTSIPKGRMIEREEFIGMLQACLADYHALRGDKRSPIGMRDAALLATLYGAGLRRAEAATLSLADYNRGAFKVHGKRNKERRVPLPRGLREALSDWLSVRGGDAGPLFLRIHKSGTIQRTGISAQVIGDIVLRRAREAGVGDIDGIVDITPHDFRRTYGSGLLGRVDIAIVKRLMGHSNIATTAGYDRRPDEAADEAVEGYDVPYRREA